MEVLQLPVEVLEYIFYYTDYITFIKLRSACKRFKMVIDRMENCKRLCIWQRFFTEMFPIECVEDLPCKHCQTDNSSYWKHKLLVMRMCAIPKTAPLQWDHFPFYSQCLENIHDIEFDKDGSLIVKNKQGRCSSFHLKSYAHKSWPPLAFFEAQEGLLSTDTLSDMGYTTRLSTSSDSKGSLHPKTYYCQTEKRVMEMQLPEDQWNFGHVTVYFGHDLRLPKLYLWEPNGHEDFGSICRAIDCPLFKVSTVKMNKNWMLIRGGHLMEPWIVPVQSFKENNHPEEPSRNTSICIKKHKYFQKLELAGDLVIGLCDDFNVWTIHLDKNLDERNWNSVALGPGTVADFSISGNLFAAITSQGFVCVSHLEKDEPFSIEKNRLRHYSIAWRKHTASMAAKIAIGYCRGITLAVLDRYLDDSSNPEHASALHIIYVTRRKSQGSVWKYRIAMQEKRKFLQKFFSCGNLEGSMTKLNCGVNLYCS